MAITKINTPELLDINTTGAKQLPSGTTAQRPTTGVTAGDFRYNTTLNYVEYYDGTSPYDAAKWFQIDYEAVAPTCTTDTINYPSGTTNTVYYKMSDATDSTLNGYNGTATDVDFNVQGKFGNAAEFNLSNSKINLPQTYGAEGENFSYSFWFKTTTSGDSIYDSQNIISKRNGANTFHLNITNANTLLISDWSGTMNKQSSTTVTDGVWRNVVFTYSNGSGLVYINGSVETSMSFTVNLPTQSISLGNNIGNWDGNSRNFGGSIDQVRIFSTTLTAANATSLYNEVQCVPAIIPSDYFNPLLYTGNGSTQSIDDLTFAPDFVWIKTRSDIGGSNHFLFDTIRGATNRLFSNLNFSEAADIDSLTSFDSNGFTVDDDISCNGSGESLVSWNWKAGGAPTATNTAGAGNVPTAGSVKIDGADSTTALAGTIAATNISANTDSGFSIVNFTSSGTVSDTIGHGLDSTPQMIIYKRTNTTSNWTVYTNVIDGSWDYLRLNLTDAKTDDTLTWATDTTIKNISTAGSWIAYCFYSVPGMSDIGSYIGNLSTAGPSIVTGFRPAFVMIKKSSDTGSWMMQDNKRNPSNPVNSVLQANLSDAELTTASVNIDFNSNGFQIKNTNGDYNTNGGSYIYLAIAEQVYNANGVTANQTNPFNDGSQVAQYEFEDNADDSQPNGYIGKGGTFNGSSSEITLPSSIALATGHNDFSVSAWVYLDNMPASNTTVITTQSEWYFYLNIRSDGSIRTYNGTGSSGITDSAAGVIVTGQWYHIAATSSSTLGKKTYLNGVNVATNLNTSNSPATSGESAVGYYNANGATSQYFLDGKIDQVRIYNTALNPNDVSLLYSETSVTSSTLDYPASTGAIALYELEGNADDTGGTYDGTATDVAWVPLYDGNDGGTVTYAAPSVSAPFLKAGVFNGSSSYMDIRPLEDALNGGYYSFSMWVNPADLTSNQRIIYTQTAKSNFAVSLSNSVLAFYQYDASVSYKEVTYTGLQANTWTHIVGLWDGSNIKLYINGSPEGSTAITSIRSFESNQFVIGRYITTLYYNGLIDQVRIFNKALDSGEILQLYNEPNN